MAHYEVINPVNGNKFVTDDYQLAYEVRKCSNTNCYSEDGALQEEALKFIEVNGDDDLILVKHDDVTRMYRGIFQDGGTDSLLAVKNDRIAPSTYAPYDKWLTPEGFGSFGKWRSIQADNALFVLQSLHTMELLWERDDSEAQA